MGGGGRGLAPSSSPPSLRRNGRARQRRGPGASASLPSGWWVGRSASPPPPCPSRQAGGAQPAEGLLALAGLGCSSRPRLDASPQGPEPSAVAEQEREGPVGRLSHDAVLLRPEVYILLWRAESPPRSRLPPPRHPRITAASLPFYCQSFDLTGQPPTNPDGARVAGEAGGGQGEGAELASPSGSICGGGRGAGDAQVCGAPMRGGRGRGRNRVGPADHLGCPSTRPKGEM